MAKPTQPPVDAFLSEAQRLLPAGVTAHWSHVDDRTASLNAIWSDRAGAGTHALGVICDLADRHNVRLVLVVETFEQDEGDPDEGLQRLIDNSARLVAWYEHFGFQRRRETQLSIRFVREPRHATRANPDSRGALLRLRDALAAPLRLSGAAATRPNPLLAHPPKAMHGADPGSVYDKDLGIQGYDRFRRAVGRAPTPEDYAGVHTTGRLALAAFYALSTTQRLGSGFGVHEPYPVILVLDVSGLEALPDFDAMVEGAQSFDMAVCKDLLEIDDFSSAGWDSESTDWPNDAWARLGVFDRNPLEAVLAAAEYDEDNARKMLQRCVDRDEPDPAVMMALVDQRRYLHDFDIDRVVEVLAVKPIHHEIVWNSGDGDPNGKEIERLEKRGWQVVAEDDPPGEIDPTTRTIWRNPALPDDPERKTQYHGTASSLAAEALPGIPWPGRAPFPVAQPRKK